MDSGTRPLALRLGERLAGRHGAEAELLLDRKRVYILPTRAGLLFGATLLVLLVGSINYQLQLGFLLTFLVASMALIGMYHTHRNLARLTLRGQRADNVYAGDVASFEILILNPTPEARHALRLDVAQRPAGGRGAPSAPAPAPPAAWCDVPARGSAVARVGLPALRRGRLACPRLRVATVFPLGLWRAWAYYTPALALIVYPRPEAEAPPLPPGRGDGRDGTATAAGGDDLAGVRPYQAGDPQKMIAWRLAARSDELSVRLFDAPGGSEVVLDDAQLPAPLDREARLARLARWVQMADAAGLRYELRLPGRHIPLGEGPAQRERCLTALALAPA